MALNRNVTDVKGKASKYTKLHEFGACASPFVRLNGGP